MKLVPVVLAGGGGTRLWPMSRESYPKQFLEIGGGESLLQQTLRRVSGLAACVNDQVNGVGQPIVVCNEAHRFLVAEQIRVMDLEASTIVLEPAGRNTAPALTIAAMIARRDGQDPVLLMSPADHLMRDGQVFQSVVAAGLRKATENHIVVFGVTPNRAETGYGYIAVGGPLDDTSGGLRLEKFVEKPDEETARGYVASGRYFWNSGMFLVRASVWLECVGKLRPDILAACSDSLAKSRIDGEFCRLDRESFTGCPSESVDYAVMEKIGASSGLQGAVFRLDTEWSDVGAWSSLWEVSRRNDDGNVIVGDVCAIDTFNSLVTSDHRLVAALGCRDMVIVETADAVMVAPKSRSQDVKSVVEWLKSQGREEHIVHRRVYRPWGSYEAVDGGERFQVKRIVVKPGGKLSLQMHHHRAEHWVVVRGTARVTRGDEVFLLSENQSTYIPLGVKHRLENPGTIPLEIIEVQSGPYLGEDDIVRFEDVYDRS